MQWQHVPDQKKHTQDGCQLALLMKRERPNKRLYAIDVGCGDGIIAKELLRLHRATFVTAIDINKKAIAAAQANLCVEIATGAVTSEAISAQKFFARRNQKDRYDRFVINPPFFAEGSGLGNSQAHDKLARHEGALKLATWARGANLLLRTGGELFCVFPTERLGALLSALAKNKCEPKELWWFKADKRKRRFFLRAVKGAKPGLIVHFDFQWSVPGLN